MSDDYEFWRAALDGERPQVHDGRPQPGYYVLTRTDAAGRTRIPVGIWRDETGEIVAHSDGPATIAEAVSIWLRVAAHPISYETYTAAMTTGEWPDIEPRLPLVEAGGLTDPMGHNQPPTFEPGSPEDFKQRIEDAASRAKALLARVGKIQDQATADRFANLRDEISALAKEAEAARKKAKKPFDDGAKQVQATWVPLIDSATLTAGALLAPIDAYLKAERARKEALAREEAERLASEAAANTGQPVAPEEVYVPPEKTRVGGAVSGRRTATTTVRSAKIIDYDLLLASIKDRQEVRDLAQSIANASARAGTSLPGCTILTEEKARG